MKKFHSFIFVFLVSTSCIWAQAKGNEVRANVNYNNTNQPIRTTPLGQAQFINDSTVVIESNVLMNVQADSYVAILSLTQLGEKLNDANQLIDSRIQSFNADLQKNGFQAKDIYIDFISQVPTYEYEIEKKLFSRTANEIPSGFELKKNIHITYSKSTDLDKLMLIAANYEIYDLVKVDYHIKNMEAVYDTLRNRSLNLVKKKVLNFSTLGLNFKPETLKYQTIAEDVTSSYPEERYASYTAFSNSSIKKNIKYQNDAKKNVTYYYSKVSYNNYDLVINPVILEPAIQFSYSLKVKYSLKKH